MGQGKYPVHPILLIDDEESWLCSLELLLARHAGINNVICCSDSLQVMEILAHQRCSLALLDYTMPSLSGNELLAMIQHEFPALPVVMLTGLDRVETAVECLNAGATDYFIKTHEGERLVAGVKRILLQQQIEQENRRLKSGLLKAELNHPECFKSIVCQSRSMEAVLHYVEAIAEGSQPVLIQGESGVGKELIAHALHLVGRPSAPWVAVNAAGLSDEQFCDTLFGHDRGAFPGATRVRKGLIEEAGGGTLFLDEIGVLSPASQLNLLRVLQDGEFYPVGGDRARKTRVRFVVVTNQNLAHLVREGAFRSDLYYRLRMHQLDIAPLRERLEDIPLLLDHFLQTAAVEFGKKRPTPPPELANLLRSYHFPGNVRELRNMVYDAVGRHQARKMSMESFRRAMGRTGQEIEESVDLQRPLVSFGDELPTIAQTVEQLLDEASLRAGGNQSVMASMLGISRSALNKRLKKLREE